MPVAVSATLAANEALADRARRGEPVLPLAFGEAGLPVHPALRAQLAAAAGRNAYGPVAGGAHLRGAAAGYWARRGLATDADLVVAGPGSKPLLFGVLSALGGDVAMPRPSWVSYAAQARLAGRRALFVATPPGQGGVPDADALVEAVRAARAAGRAVRSVVVTLPDNPTGTLAAPGTVRRLCEAARELDLMIVSDEIYRDLVYEGRAGFAGPAAFAPERTVVSTGLSKSLALGGWRIGVVRLPHCAAGRELRDRLLGLGSEIWSSAAGPVQQAAAYAFGEPAELTERIAASTRLHRVVARAVAGVFADAKAEVPRPQAAFYLYPDFQAWRATLALDHDVHGGTELARLLLDRYGVGVLPGAAFGEDDAGLRLRVATGLLYGRDDEQRLAALAAPDPLCLPWIRAHLDRLAQVLGEVTGA